MDENKDENEGSTGTACYEREIQYVKEQQEERDMFIEVITESLEEAEKIIQGKGETQDQQEGQTIVDKLVRLKYEFEPKFQEIWDMNKSIQKSLKKLKLRKELVTELKISTAFSVRVKFLSNKIG